MSIYLAGGGTPQQEAPAWRAAFEGVGRALYWPFALQAGVLTRAERWLRRSLADLGIDVEVDTWTSLAGRDPADLDRYDLLFVGGGLTSTLAREVLDHGFSVPVRRFVDHGGRYLGGSAGALLACDEITIAGLVEPDPESAGMPGIGLVHDLAVYPHADQDPPGRHAAAARRLGVPVAAVPEDAALRVAPDGWHALGTGRVTLVRPDGTTSPVDPA